MAQYGGTKTPEQFYAIYEEDSGYKSVELDEGELMVLADSKDTGRKLRSVLKGIKHIIYLEYKNEPRIVRGKMVLEERPNSGNVVYMRILPDSALKGRVPVTQLSFHSFPGRGPTALYKLAGERINFKPFTFLMTSYENEDKIDFLKREEEGGFTEYLLIKNNILIIIESSMEFKHYKELEQIVYSLRPV